MTRMLDRRVASFAGLLLAAALMVVQMRLAPDARGGPGPTPTRITVEGRTDPGQPLTLNVLDAAGNFVDDPAAKGSTTAGADGAFQFMIILPPGATPGDYTAVVTRSGTSSEVQRSAFTIASPGGERIAVDPAAGTVGTRHTLRGDGFRPGLIEYGVYDKNGRALGLGDVTVGSSGGFEVVLVTEEYHPGKYMVYVAGPSQDAGTVASALLVVDAPMVAIKVRTAGAKGGRGTVALVSPLDAGVPDGESWEKSFSVGTAVQLLARPVEASHLVGWTVDGESRGRSPTLDVTLTAPTTVVATFEGEFRAAKLASVPTGAAFSGEGSEKLFAIGTDGSVWTWLNDAARFGWESLGGTSLRSVIATKNPAGGVAVFAIARDGRIMHSWQLEGWPGRWSGWTDVSGPPEMGASLPLPVKGVVATENPTGGMALFAIASDDRIWHAWQDDPGGAWVGWTDVSGPPEMGTSLPLPVKSVVATRNPTGGMALFAIGGDDRIWHAWQDRPKGAWVGWTDVSGPPEMGASLPLPVKSVVATRNPTGGMALFAIGGDNRIWHAWQDRPKGAWVGWTDVSGPPEMRTAIPTPARSLVDAQVLDGGLAIFAVGHDDHVWFAWQNTPKGAWNGWADLGGDSPVELVVRSSDSEIEGIRIFTRTADGQVWTRHQPFPKSPWARWYSLTKLR